MPRQLLSAALAHQGRGAALLAAGAAFVFGVAVGAAIGPSVTTRVMPPIEPAQAATAAQRAPLPQGLGPQLAYPTEVLRIIDGDTFEARVRVWPGLDVATKVRLRGIDAAELHARCDDERVKAEAARDALGAILAEGNVAISHVGVDKYGGRVDADVATRNTGDVSAAMLNGGFARSYGGGKRGSWCG